jgi:hypothetical protein
LRQMVDKETTTQHSELSEQIRAYIEAAANNHRHRNNPKRVAKAIAEAAAAAFDGLAVEVMRDRERKWIREHIFSAFNIAKAMDLHGGLLNLAAIELLRTLEHMGLKYARTMLPSSSQIQRILSKMERIGNALVPFKMTFDEAEGESARFEYDKVVTYLLKSYHLAEASMLRPISMAQSIDAARLTSNINHIMAGLKMNDRGAICPRTGLPLVGGANPNAQSREVVFPMHINLGNESKAKFAGEFRPCFEFFHMLNTIGLNGSKPMNITAEVDMSAAWKMIGRGGGSNAKIRPCHCCGAHRDHMHHPKRQQCNRFCTNNPDDFQCYHAPIITDARVEEMQQEVQVMLATMQEQLNAIKGSKLTKDDPNDSDDVGKEDKQSIHYGPQSATEKLHFSMLVNCELALRALPTCDNMTIRRERLRVELTKEHRLRELKVELKTNERHEGALFLLMSTIPCILHMEMRVGLKILSVLIMEGLSEAKAGRLYSELRSENGRVEAYIKEVEHIVNSQMLGNTTDKSIWKCPYDTKDKKLGTISLENGKVRQILDKFGLLIDASVPNLDRMHKWKRCLPAYTDAIVIVRQKADFLDADIEKFQQMIDKWFQDWVHLNGRGGMTNYIHMLCCGHIAEYMYEHRNLYRHSQQGWEAFNALLKTFFFRRTQRGGGRGRRTKLQPIARWLQRRMLFMGGMTEGEMIEHLERLNQQVQDESGESEEQDGIEEVPVEREGDVDEELMDMFFRTAMI